MQSLPNSLTDKTFEKSWPLSAPQVGKVLQNTGDRIVCEISANEGHFVFKVSSPSRSEEEIKRDSGAFGLLGARDFRHIPRLLKTREGEDYLSLDGRFVYVMERIEGQTPEATPENWEQFGRIAANLHAAPNYPYETLFQVQPKDIRNKANSFAFRNGFQALVDRLPRFDGLSQSVIHTDIGPHNAVQKSDRTIILVDWDDAGVGTTILGPVVSRVTNYSENISCKEFLLS